MTALTGSLALFASQAGGAGPNDPGSPADCARIAAPAERLACHDRATPLSAPREAASDREDGPGQGDSDPTILPVIDAAEVADDAAQLLSRVWELEPQTRRPRFQLLPHHTNYLLPVRASTRTNPNPTSPAREAPANLEGLDGAELKFQFSVKLKVAENLVGRNGDLWFGYTQRAHWQVYNNGLSKPFRELNYSPELILSLRADSELLGWRWQVLNVALLHESNGLSEPGSRSWNRLYSEFGFTRERWMLMFRPWLVLGDREDNPDITDYMGRGDLRLSWLGRRHTVSLLARYSPGHDRGALQLDWAFPLAGSLKGYLQVFSGYGESLIDYNHAQTTLGVGFLLTSWQ